MMKLSDLNKKMNLLTDKIFYDREISGYYICDLLSHVMSNAMPNNAWITIMDNINILAVASLTNISCIILCENVSLSTDIIKKANEEKIVIFQSDKTAYELASEIHLYEKSSHNSLQ